MITNLIRRVRQAISGKKMVTPAESAPRMLIIGKRRNGRIHPLYRKPHDR